MSLWTAHTADDTATGPYPRETTSNSGVVSLQPSVISDGSAGAAGSQHLNPIRPVRRRCLTRPPLGLRTRPGRLTRGQQLRPAGHQEGQSKAWQDYGQSKRIPIRRLISALSAYRRSGEDELICISKHRSVPLVTAVAAACCMCLSVKELTGAAELVFASMLRQAWRSF